MRSTRLRLSSFVVAFALVAGSLLLIQQRADAAPASSAVSAAVAGAALDGVQAQLGNFSSIVCAILLAVRSAFAGFFGGFVTPIIDSLLVAFGCAPSG